MRAEEGLLCLAWLESRKEKAMASPVLEVDVASYSALRNMSLILVRILTLHYFS